MGNIYTRVYQKKLVRWNGSFLKDKVAMACGYHNKHNNSFLAFIKLEGHFLLFSTLFLLNPFNFQKAGVSCKPTSKSFNPFYKFFWRYWFLSDMLKNTIKIVERFKKSNFPYASKKELSKNKHHLLV